MFDKIGVYKVTAVKNQDNYVLVCIGDIVKDNEVSVTDYQKLVNQALSGEYLEYSDIFNSDIDGDCVLDINDKEILIQQS